MDQLYHFVWHKNHFQSMVPINMLFILKVYACYLLYNIHALPSFQIDTPYGCDDNMALATPNNWAVSCPSTEDVVSRSTVILSELPDLLPANEICKLQVHIMCVLYQRKLHPKNKFSGKLVVCGFLRNPFSFD